MSAASERPGRRERSEERFVGKDGASATEATVARLPAREPAPALRRRMTLAELLEGSEAMAAFNTETERLREAEIAAGRDPA